jgi:hypothetical protein
MSLPLFQFHAFNYRLIVLFCSLAIAVSTSGCTCLNESAIIVEKEPIGMVERKLPKLPANLERQSEGGGSGLTMWYFKCSNRFAGEFTANTDAAQIVHASLHVTGVTSHIGLDINVYVDDRASAALKTHESGHCQICCDVYRVADRIMNDAALSVAGKTFQGSGLSVRQAGEAAVQAANEAICEVYRQRTVAVVNKVSASYDQITKHGCAGVDSEDGLRQAFLLNDYGQMLRADY